MAEEIRRAKLSLLFAREGDKEIIVSFQPGGCKGPGYFDKSGHSAGIVVGAAKDHRRVFAVVERIAVFTMTQVIIVCPDDYRGLGAIVQETDDIMSRAFLFRKAHFQLYIQ